MNKKLLNLKNVGVPVGIVLLIILALIFLLTRNNTQEPLDSSTTTDLVAEDSDATLLPVENLKQAKLANTVVTFNDSYYINTVVQGKNVSGVTCGVSTNDSCIINFITDGTSTYYLATPFEPTINDGIEKEDIAKPIDLTSGTTYLKHSILEVVNEEGDILLDESLTAQIYGCVTDGICVGSGWLDTTDLATNQAQITKFEDFVKSLNVR